MSFAPTLAAPLPLSFILPPLIFDTPRPAELRIAPTNELPLDTTPPAAAAKLDADAFHEGMGAEGDSGLDDCEPLRL